MKQGKAKQLRDFIKSHEMRYFVDFSDYSGQVHIKKAFKVEINKTEYWIYFSYGDRPELKEERCLLKTMEEAKAKASEEAAAQSAENAATSEVNESNSETAAKAAEAVAATLSGDEKTGAKIIATALQAPIRQIAENAGVDGSVVFEKIKNSKKVGYGYNAYTETYMDMIENGIVDPTKVTRSSLENAASIAACVLTTESLVADKPAPEADAAAMAAAAQGGMY